MPDSLSWQLLEEAQKTREGPSRSGSFSAHAVEDSFCGGDAVHFHGDLLLLLQDLSQCLEPCESLSQDPWHSFEGRNACCSVRTSCLESLWLSLVRGPEGTSLWIWKVLHSCWSGLASPLSHGKIETSPPCVQLWMFVLFSVWRLGTSVCEVW